jgi:hypothetical protein
MHHHGRYPPRHHAVAVCHRDREIFVRRQDRPRNGNARLRRLRIGLYQGRKIGPGIAEQIVDTAIGQQCKIRARDVADLLCFRSVAALQARCHRCALLLRGRNLPSSSYTNQHSRQS